jgi:hypothetical protein
MKGWFKKKKAEISTEGPAEVPSVSITAAVRKFGCLLSLQ